MEDKYKKAWIEFKQSVGRLRSMGYHNEFNLTHVQEHIEEIEAIFNIREYPPNPDCVARHDFHNPASENISNIYYNNNNNTGLLSSILQNNR